MEQFGLFDALPKKKVEPRKEPTDGTDHHEILRKVCRDGTYMIFLYGENPHMKIARTHDSDDGGDNPIYVMTKNAMAILEEYCFERHSRHSGQFGKAVVYLADRKAQKRKAKEKGSAWLNTDRFV